MRNSKISWTEDTFNPWQGCRHVTTECDHCYAETFIVNRQGKDFGSITRTKTWGDPVKFNADARPNGHWFKPKGAREKIFVDLGRRPRIFCASWTDFFIQEADAWRPEAWKVIRECPNLDFLILTKRPRLMPSRLPADWGNGYPNVWLGTTCGVRSSYPRIDDLRKVPALVRFISAEPLLESLHDIDLAGIDWLIAGGESGSGFRPMKDEWAIELRDRCREQGVAFHFKQHSAFRPGTDPLLHGIKYHESPLVQIATAAAPEPADEDTDRDLPISPEEADDETRGTRDRAQG